MRIGHVVVLLSFAVELQQKDVCYFVDRGRSTLIHCQYNTVPPIDTQTSSIGNRDTSPVSRQTIVARAILPGIASSSVVGNDDL